MELESVPKATRRIGELNRAIKALGTPNIGAIEEYERVNGRYTYLSDQRADVEQAKGELTGVIDQHDPADDGNFRPAVPGSSTTASRQTFLELFGGGKARLELEDEKDILNCGIEIKVQPPGKQLKTITLLSGGEKAFVAIALYFAILEGPPHPLLRDGRDRGRPGRGQRGALSPAICGASPGRPSSSSSPTGGAPWRRPTCSTASPCRSGASAGSSPSTSTIWPKS